MAAPLVLTFQRQARGIYVRLWTFNGLAAYQLGQSLQFFTGFETHCFSRLDHCWRAQNRFYPAFMIALGSHYLPFIFPLWNVAIRSAGGVSNRFGTSDRYVFAVYL
jgi:hypothetical protein